MKIITINNVVRGFFYTGNLVWVYFHMLPTISKSIADICRKRWQCQRYIVDTWYGNSIDLADNQWSEFRNSLALLWIAMLFTSFLNYSIRSILNSKGISGNALAPSIHLIIGLSFLFIMHGWHALIILIISSIGFALSKYFEYSSYCTLAVWIYAITVLIFKESYRLLPYIPSPYVDVLFVLFDHQSYGGMYRWHLASNFLVLRLISFAMDNHWECIHNRHSKTVVTKTKDEDKGTSSSNTSASTQDPSIISSDGSNSENNSYNSSCNNNNMYRYNYLTFLTYCEYCPLYMAGPILPFNAFVSFLDKPHRDITNGVVYGVRWLLCLVLLETLLHYCPFFAIVRSALVAVSYLLLQMMWLKFLLIWRFFRLWALLDGMEPPENMTRCMSNNFSLSQFWRGWHSSYNLWIIRYMYGPLGGRERPVRNAALVFLFVALWHDFEWKLWLWAALNSVFVFGKRLCGSSLFRSAPQTVSCALCSLGAATNIIALVGVNLAGYAVGMSDIAGFVSRMMTREGLQVLLVCYYILCVGYNLMIDIATLRKYL
eukprot:gene5092-10189_t